MGKRLVIVLLILVIFPILSLASQDSFDKKVNIHGGVTKTKDMAIWELYQYKYTKLLRKSPLCYAPWESYLAVDKYVEVSNIDNHNALVIKEDLAAKVSKDANFNKKFAKRFKGRSILRIYDYCERTKYVLHKKTAREVFEHRQGDCAGKAAAFYVICKTNKIPVRYIIGFCGKTCHAWNKVKIKGKWYYVDCAMDKYLSKKLWKHYSIMEEW